MKRNNPQRIIDHEEFHEFLTRCGMEISAEHAERVTEIISTYGEDHFTEQELVDYVLESQASQKKKEAKKRREQAAAEKAGGGA